ncbi:hypothetical protein ACJX0J_034188, partial [Zea mays]
KKFYISHSFCQTITLQKPETELTELVNIIDSVFRRAVLKVKCWRSLISLANCLLHYTHEKLSALVNLVQEKHHLEQLSSCTPFLFYFHNKKPKRQNEIH